MNLFRYNAKFLQLSIENFHQINSKSNLLKRSFFTSKNLFDLLQFKLADIGEGIAEVNVKEWYVQVGDKVKQFDKICEVQSDKATVTITSRYDGIIKKIYYNIDDIAAVGKPLVDIETEEIPQAPMPEPVHIEDSLEKSTPMSSSSTSGSQEFLVNRVLATPAVRKLAIDSKVNIANVQGSGKDGRILKDDIIRYLKENQQETEQAAREVTEPQKVEVSTPLQTQVPQKVQVHASEHAKLQKLVTDKKEQIKGIRKSMVKTMQQSNQIPHFSYCDEYDMTTLVDLRKDLKEFGKKRGVNISYMPIIIKACSLALHSYPILNASVDEKCEYLTYKSAHNIGLAMDTPDGLLVPNIKNVEAKTIFEIANEINRLQALGSNSKLPPHDLTGGTFTLSNIGSIGGTYMKPVILSPEVAIGALGKIQLLPRYDHLRHLVPKSLMNVSWSADHRVIDGASMARFSNLVKHYLENPSLLILDMK